MIVTGNSKTRQVWIDGKELLPDRSQAFINHSPDGFAWGYGGSGPGQLALAILLEIDPDNALARYQAFKWKVIANLDMESDFELEIKDYTLMI